MSPTVAKSFQVLIKVMVGDKELNFHLIVHRSRLLTLLLDKDFYKTYGELPKGSHREIEILEPKQWDPGLANSIHIRTSSSTVACGRKFICYSRPIPTDEKALEMIRVWCLGTAYTLALENEDFQTIASLANPDRTVFIQEMKDVYKIEIVEFRII